MSARTLLMAAASAGPPGASLNLSFMSGTLDPRITFTRASTATYFDATATVRTAAANAPRWDCDPVTGALRGLLIEETRTNLTLQSADLSNAAWQKANANGPVAPVVTGNQAVSPDGTTTAARAVFPAVSGASAVSFIQQPLASGATAAPYSFSVWLRGSVGGEQTYICIYDGASVYSVRQRVTLTTSWVRYVITSGNLTTAAWYTFVGTDLRDSITDKHGCGNLLCMGRTVRAWAVPVVLYSDDNCGSIAGGGCVFDAIVALVQYASIIHRC